MNNPLSHPYVQKILSWEKNLMQRLFSLEMAIRGKMFLRLSLRDRITFIKQLSVLARAGIPLLPALRMLREQTKSKAMGNILDQIVRDVENGQYLATALGRFKKVFGELTIHIIAVGEASGTLTANLDYLAITLKKQYALRRKVISASVYPIFIIISTIVITILLTVFFFPKVIPVLKSVNYELPWSTKALMFISDVMKHHGVLIFFLAIAVIIGLVLSLKIKKVRFGYERFLLTMPFLKQCMQAYNTANICRTLGLLLNSGVVVVKSFQITADTTTSLLYKEKLMAISEEIMKGEKISLHMRKDQHLFPAMVSQMVSVGESTGKLSDTFLYLADIYEEEMDELTKNLSSTVEPFLLVFMGLLVGFIAISIITPIYGITQHLTPK